MRLLAIILLLGLVSCRPETEKPPGNMLGKQDMVNALIRIHMLEADLEARNVPTDSAKIIFEREEKKILDSLKIDEKRFRASYDFFLKHPEYLENIYTTVVDSLSLREAIVTQRELLGDTTAAQLGQAISTTPQ